MGYYEMLSNCCFYLDKVGFESLNCACIYSLPHSTRNDSVGLYMCLASLHQPSERGYLPPDT